MENRNIIIYSTNTCFRCKLVKQMLSQHNVEYTETTDIEAMKEKGFKEVPMMEVDGRILDYSDVLTWLKDNNYYSLGKVGDK